MYNYLLIPPIALSSVSANARSKGSWQYRKPDFLLFHVHHCYNNDVHEIVGNPAYDIATNLWNERWQIPTKEQWEELRDNCTWTYAYDSERKVYGYTVTAENGNSIYLPFYDYETGSRVPNGVSTSSGYYWTSTEYSGLYGNALKLTSTTKYIDNNYKYYRMPIRPVLVK